MVLVLPVARAGRFDNPKKTRIKGMGPIDPGNTAPKPRNTVPDPGNTGPYPGNTVPDPGNTGPDPESPSPTRQTPPPPPPPARPVYPSCLCHELREVEVKVLFPKREY